MAKKPVSDLAARISALLIERRMSAAEASRKAKLGETAVHDIISGRNKSPSNKALTAIAQTLNTSVGYLTNDLTSPKEQDLKTAGKNSFAEIEIVGAAEAGAWRVPMSLHSGDRRNTVHAPRSRHYGYAKHFALRIAGDSMNAASPPILDGQIALCVDMIDAGLEIMDGKVYAVRRTSDGGQTYECTIKQAFVFKDRIELRPESLNTSHETIVVKRGADAEYDTMQVEAIGLVYGTFASFE